MKIYSTKCLLLNSMMIQQHLDEIVSYNNLHSMNDAAVFVKHLISFRFPSTNCIVHAESKTIMHALNWFAYLKNLNLCYKHVSFRVTWQLKGQCTFIFKSIDIYKDVVTVGKERYLNFLYNWIYTSNMCESIDQDMNGALGDQILNHI